MQKILLLKVWDVQHGNALFLRLPTGEQIVIDLGKGSFRTKKRRWSPLEHLSGTRKAKHHIDVLVISHPHLDHIEDISNLKRFTLGQVVAPTHLLKKNIIHKKTRKRDIPTLESYWQLVKGTKPPQKLVYGEVTIEFYVNGESTQARLNDHSILTLVHYQDYSLVLPGDNEDFSLRRILAEERFTAQVRPNTVLLASHHGRAKGFYREFVKVLAPLITIVSDGRATGTSAVQKYHQASKGYHVFLEAKAIAENRTVLSTRKDGWIQVEVGTYQGESTIRIKAKQHT